MREEKEQLAKEKEELLSALNRLKESMEQQTAEEEHTQDSDKSKEEPKQTQDEVEQSQETQAPEHEESHEIPIQRETLHAEAEHPAGQKGDETKQEESHPETEQASASATQQPEQPHHSDVLEAYQEMKTKLEESTLHYPYTRITSETDGCQYIYESRTLQLKAELFIWGVEGKEVILDETHFIPYNEIANIEGLESPFATEAMECDFRKAETEKKWQKLCSWLSVVIIRFTSHTVTRPTDESRSATCTGFASSLKEYPVSAFHTIKYSVTCSMVKSIQTISWQCVLTVLYRVLSSSTRF